MHLLTVLIKNPNFLILDEPTNDLDLLTLQKLEEFLEGFGGCLIIVSHDRYFLDKLVDHLFIFEGNAQIKDFWGPYSEYKIQLEAKKREQNSAKTNSSDRVVEVDPIVAQEPKNKKKLGFKDKFELENLDKEIPQLEKEKAELEKELQSGDLPYEKVEVISNRITSIVEELEDKELRWLELDELRS